MAASVHTNTPALGPLRLLPLCRKLLEIPRALLLDGAGA